VVAGDCHRTATPKLIIRSISRAPPAGVHVFHAGTKKLQDGSIVTDGGRVMAVCAAGDTLEQAVELAYKGVDAVDFEGKTYRRDIAHR